MRTVRRTSDMRGSISSVHLSYVSNWNQKFPDLNEIKKKGRIKYKQEIERSPKINFRAGYRS